MKYEKCLLNSNQKLQIHKYKLNLRSKTFFITMLQNSFLNSFAQKCCKNLEYLISLFQEWLNVLLGAILVYNAQ